jgi:hydrogenase expression/formation protein HypC
MDSNHPQQCHAQPDADHCVTCGDDAVEVVVLGLLADATALVGLDAATLEVDISLVEAVQPGDRLLVHGGVALSRP